MSPVRSNVIANIAGQAISVLVALVCTPFYIRLLGVEAYGLIAFFVTLQLLLQLLDLGLGVTLNRELARARQASFANLPALVTTLESWYWALGAGCGVVLFVCLPRATLWWLNAERMHSDEIAQAARAFALLAALQWLAAFYSNGLAGLQRQVLSNAIQIPSTLLANLGGLALIWLGPRSVAALLAWQALVLFGQFLVLRYWFWSCAGFRRTTGFNRLAVLREVWRFSAGMSAISITGVVMSQLDKLILSRLLSLESFAHYGLANTVARGLYVLITPVFNAYFPRLSALVASQNGAEVRRCYDAGAQMMAVLLLPTAALVALFAPEILELWLRNRNLAHAVAPLAALLVIGTCLNGLMNLPYALQLAHGNTRIGLIINVGLVSVLIPTVTFAAIYVGAVGAAATWAAANAIYLAVGLPITHRLLLREGGLQWLVRDVQPAFTASLLLVGAARFACVPPESPPWLAGFLAFVWLAAILAAASVTRAVRQAALQAVRRWV